MIKKILWYLGVILAVILLALGFMTKSWIITLVGVAITVALKVTNKHIPLPKVYDDLGVENDLFEGKR